MRCPNCGYKEDFVVDSRATSQGSAIRRRRECVKCGKRFTTYEYIEEVSLIVVKKDGRREPFDRKKILSGIMKACEKRPISVEKMEELVSSIEHAIQRKSDREITSRHIGELVIEKLKKIDDVAYVRFASVYRQFKDIGQFIKELEGIIGTQKPALKPRAKNKKGRKQPRN